MNYIFKCKALKPVKDIRGWNLKDFGILKSSGTGHLR